MPITPPPSDTPGDHAGDPEAYDTSRKSWYRWFQVFCVELLAYIDVVAAAATAAATAAANAVLASKVTLDGNGNLTLPAGKFCYGAGAFGSGTVSGGSGGSVTINRPSGQITMPAVAGATAVYFTVYSNKVAQSDHIGLTITLPSNGYYRYWVYGKTDGTFSVFVETIGAARNEQIVLTFAVKGVSTT